MRTLLVGCYTNGVDDGLLLFHLAEETHSREVPVHKSTLAVPDASYALATGKHLVVLSEGVAGVSAISTWERENEDTYEKLQRLEPNYEGACHASIQDTTIAVAFYDSGSIALFRITKDGYLAPKCNPNTVHFTKFTEVDEIRQDAPHAHCIVPFSPDGREFLATDLGGDTLYQLEASDKGVAIKAEYEIPGGPRHVLPVPEKGVVLVICELSNKLHLFDIKTMEDCLSTDTVHPQMESFVRHDDDSQMASHLAVEGDFVYVSNRGFRNNVAVFSFPYLRRVSSRSSHGHNPRHFQLIPDAIIVANQSSHNVYCFSRDSQKGRIGDVLWHFELDKPPVFVLLLPKDQKELTNNHSS